jgi:hypothetical protein
VVVPLQCEFFALEGLSQLLTTVEHVRSTLNPNLVIHGVVLTMYDARNSLAGQVAADPSTEPELAAIIAEALVDLESQKIAKKEKAAEESKQRQFSEMQGKLEIERQIQLLSSLKQEKPLEEWCLWVAEHGNDIVARVNFRAVTMRELVGVRNRPVKVTIRENAVLKAKQKEVASRRYVYRTTLIKRGCTPELIDAVLGQPDKLVTNPHYRSGPRAMLYRIDRVESAEGLRLKLSEPEALG